MLLKSIMFTMSIDNFLKIPLCIVYCMTWSDTQDL